MVLCNAAGMMSTKEIAEKMGRSESSIQSKALKLGLNLDRKRQPFKVVELARDLREKHGLLISEIAEKLEIPKPTVSGWLNYSRRSGRYEY